MYIELLTKTSMWKGDKGVVMDIKARSFPRDPTPLSLEDALNTRNARVEIGISISGLGEVTAYEAGNPTWYGPRPVDKDLMEIVPQWLVDKGLMSEWEEETAKFILAISRVDLPFASEAANGYLLYHFKIPMTPENYYRGVVIITTVSVDHEKATVTVGLRQGDDKYEDDSIELGSFTITGPVNTDTVKGVVSQALDKLWDLLKLPLIED